MQQQSVTFSHAKKRTRAELRLPQLHFIAADDWADKLGEKSFLAWLKFYTYADRRAEDRENDLIPSSMNGLCKKLGVSKSTFYQTVIPALWNFGLIDFEEYENGNVTALNIIVYEYPQNKPELATKPLDKIRDYQTEWQSKNRENGKKGGRKAVNPVPTNEGGSIFEPGEGGSKIEPGGGSKIEPNNVLKGSSNYSNTDDDDRIIITSQIFEKYKEKISLNDFQIVADRAMDHICSDFRAYLDKSVETEIAKQSKKSSRTTVNKSNGPVKQSKRRVQQKPVIPIVQNNPAPELDPERDEQAIMAAIAELSAMREAAAARAAAAADAIDRPY